MPDKPVARIEITLHENCTADFILDAKFWKNPDAQPNIIKRRPQAATSFRALCIFFLLCKYQHFKFPHDFRFFFEVPNQKNTWIATLSETLFWGTPRAFVRDFLEDVQLLREAGRGSGHNRKPGNTAPMLHLNEEVLPVGNISMFVEPYRGSDKSKEIAPDHFNYYALKLEKNYSKWTEVVPQTLNSFEEREAREAKSKKATVSVQIPEAEQKKATYGGAAVNSGDYCLATANMHEVFSFTGEIGKRLKSRLTNPLKNDRWYVVSLVVGQLGWWEFQFKKAVQEFGVNLQWVIQGTEALEHWPVMAQWEMMHPRARAQSRSTTKKWLLESFGRLARWNRDIKLNGQKGKRGTFKVYESRLVHYYSAFLAVPSVSPTIQASAPNGTVCLVGPYAMFPTNIEERQYFYFESPSPVLDNYYRSILKYFAVGKSWHYIKPVDLAIHSSSDEKLAKKQPILIR